MRWIALTLLAAAQIASAVTPDALDKASALEAITLQPLNHERLAEEDALREIVSAPYRFAVPRKVSISPASHGEWKLLADGRWMWRLRVSAPDAASLNFGFDQFQLPSSAQLSFLSIDGSDKGGPFGADRNNRENAFYSPVILGGDTILALTVAADERQDVKLTLTQIGHGYRGFGTRSKACKSGSCNTDPVCLPEGNPWNTVRRSVGAITVNGTDTCSGSLLNNTSQDRRLLFATATHCGITESNDQSVVIYWNYEFPTCRTPGSSQSGAAPGPKPTDPWNIQTGSQFLAATQSPFSGGSGPGSERSDFTLLQLNGTADSRANLYWGGWDRSTTPAVCARNGGAASSDGLCAGIHHPGVDEKRISFVQQNYQVGNISAGVGVHWRADWTFTPQFPTIPGSVNGVISITEGGSSGSPLYNAQQQLVGVLSGGPSSCTATDKWDFYGALFHAWNGPPGATAAQRMRDHLDPTSSGVTSLAGRGQCTPPSVPTNLLATANGDNRIDLTWTAGAGADRYRVFRSRGACPGSGYQQIGEVVGTSFSDTTASGGVAYSYRVASFGDAETCESAQSTCAGATTTGACRLAPVFAGLTTAASAQTASCAVNLTWSAGTADCPAATNIVYNVYRGTDAAFIPSASNRIASCLTATTFSDASAQPATSYHYVVRAEDDLTGSTGQCRSGNEDLNLERRASQAAGPDVESFNDNATTAANFTITGTGAGVDFALSTAAFRSGPSSWFVNAPDDPADRQLTLTQPIAMPANAFGQTLEFYHRYFNETNYDGGVLEYSFDGTTWVDILAANGPVPANPNRFIVGGYVTTPLNSGTANPLAGRRAWHGDAGTAFNRVAVDLADFAGRNLYLRWRFGADGSVFRTGWFIDDFRIYAPSACTNSSEVVFANGFE